jgi:uncharacterized protein YjiS (DUF1127 family)
MAHSHVLSTQVNTGSVPQRVSEAVKRAWVGYWTHRARRATVYVLHTLDDRTLKDIGMDRSEIESVVYAQPRDRGRSSSRRITMCARA